MEIRCGERIPEVQLAVMADEAPATVNTSELFAGKRVLLFAVPGAFTPTCSARHLPGFVDHLEDFHAASIDTVACMAVNDAYVMDAWSRAAGADGILMLADGNGTFTRALGLDTDSTAFHMGIRSKRFALVAEDGVVSHLFVEQPGEFRVSSAEYVLAEI